MLVEKLLLVPGFWGSQVTGGVTGGVGCVANAGGGVSAEFRFAVMLTVVVGLGASADVLTWMGASVVENVPSGLAA
jgi:hypothetical protein